jgi:hypothetical protein
MPRPSMLMRSFVLGASGCELCWEGRFAPLNHGSFGRDRFGARGEHSGKGESDLILCVNSLFAWKGRRRSLQRSEILTIVALESLRTDPIYGVCPHRGPLTCRTSNGRQ